MNPPFESPEEIPNEEELFEAIRNCIDFPEAGNNQLSPELNESTGIDEIMDEIFAKDPAPQSPDNSTEESQ